MLLPQKSFAGDEAGVVRSTASQISYYLYIRVASTV
jgi:hypothetical protein